MRIRQIVLAAHDLPAGRAALAALLPLGAPFRDPGVAEFGIDNAVFGFGDQFIEVISPTRPDTACGRHLARHGDSGYMLILQTDDFAREQARWAALGLRTVWNTTYPDITAAHLHPKDVGGAIVSVDEPRPAASWRWGGPDWQVQPGALGSAAGARHHAACRRPAGPGAALGPGVRPPRPHGRGQRLARVAGRRLRRLRRRARRAAMAVAGFTLAVAEPDAVLAAARAAGLPVQGHRVELLGAQLQIEPL
jgi:hypothetical protein